MIRAMRDIFVQPAVWGRVLGVLLVLASILKSIDPSSLHDVFRFLGFPSGFISLASIIVIVWEAAIGALLIANPWPTMLRMFALLTMSAFTVVLLVLRFSQAPPDCSCLGKWVAFEDVKLSLTIGIIRNAALIGWGLVPFIMLWRKKRSESHVPAFQESSPGLYPN